MPPEPSEFSGEWNSGVTAENQRLAKNCRKLSGEPMCRTDKTRPVNRESNSTGTARASRRSRRLYLFYASILAFFSLAVATRLLADAISGTVKDPSGAVVVGARIEITGGSLSQPIILSS